MYLRGGSMIYVACFGVLKQASGELPAQWLLLLCVKCLVSIDTHNGPQPSVL